VYALISEIGDAENISKSYVSRIRPAAAGEIARAARRDLAGNLWAQQGKRREARDLLAPIYEWFTEGFNTPDRIEANALLDKRHSRHPFSAWPRSESARSTGWLPSTLCNGTNIRFDPVSRPPERNYKLGACHRSAKLLIHLPNAKWVPNGPSERPQRKRALESDSEPSSASPRCTAIHEKRQNSWAFQGRSADGETVRIGHVGGGRGTVVKPSSVMYGPPPVRKAKMERGDMHSLHQCIRPLGSLAWAMMEMRAPRSS
jgi:hypothetical protein